MTEPFIPQFSDEELAELRAYAKSKLGSSIDLVVRKYCQRALEHIDDPLFPWARGYASLYVKFCKRYEEEQAEIQRISDELSKLQATEQ